jgi:hypothetical protein
MADLEFQVSLHTKIKQTTSPFSQSIEVDGSTFLTKVDADPYNSPKKCKLPSLQTSPAPRLATEPDDYFMLKSPTANITIELESSKKKG